MHTLHRPPTDYWLLATDYFIFGRNSAASGRIYGSCARSAQLLGGELCHQDNNMLTIYDLDTPALLVDLDRLERNIADMAQTAKTGGKALWPHTKTHKTPEIARMQVQAGAGGLTVAKLGEAETLAAAGY